MVHSYLPGAPVTARLDEGPGGRVFLEDGNEDLTVPDVVLRVTRSHDISLRTVIEVLGLLYEDDSATGDLFEVGYA